MNNQASEPDLRPVPDRLKAYKKGRIITWIILAIFLSVTLIWWFTSSKHPGSSKQGNTNEPPNQAGEITLTVNVGGQGDAFGGKVLIQLSDVHLDAATSKYLADAVVTFPERKVTVKEAREEAIINYNKSSYEVRIESIKQNLAEFTVKKIDMQNVDKE
jgi:hypothetical protein